ncbi:MAG: alpha/beta hydrolase [Alphaproteobacteria bacterium]
MPTPLALLHSPLLGDLSWRGVAQGLRARGREVTAPAWPKLGDLGGDFYRSLALGMAAELGDTPTIAVLHSGAGAMAPALEAASGAVQGFIFVDAILPHPGRSWFDTAPPPLAQSLRDGAEFGMLPAWDAWWPPGALQRLLSDESVREALTSELEPLPLAYFEEAAPDIQISRPAAYLQLSGAYDEEGRLATRQGWPLVRLPMHHLAMLTHVEAVATAIEGLAGRLETRLG